MIKYPCSCHFRSGTAHVVAEWCIIRLSSMVFSYAFIELWDHSGSVRQFWNSFWYYNSISNHHPEYKTPVTQSEGGQHAETGGTVLNVQHRLLSPPVKSYHHHSEETGMSYSSCEGETRKGTSTSQIIHMWTVAIHEDTFIIRKWACYMLCHITA
jgi:hypothetical protein